MRIMSIDCEFNQPSKKCIQIGASIYDVRSGDLIAKFETYVNPQEPIDPYIVQLTRITDQNVSGAPTIKEAYFILKNFHSKWKPFMNPLVWGSGTRNDSLSIYEEASPGEANFMGYRVIDVKTLYQSLQMFRNSTIRGGLKNSCEKMGIGWDGAYGDNHGALADAHNTFRIWYHLMRKFYEGFKESDLKEKTKKITKSQSAD